MSTQKAFQPQLSVFFHLRVQLQGLYSVLSASETRVTLLHCSHVVPEHILTQMED